MLETGLNIFAIARVPPYLLSQGWEANACKGFGPSAPFGCRLQSVNHWYARNFAPGELHELAHFLVGLRDIADPLGMCRLEVNSEERGRQETESVVFSESWFLFPRLAKEIGHDKQKLTRPRYFLSSARPQPCAPLGVMGLQLATCATLNTNETLPQREVWEKTVIFRENTKQHGSQTGGAPHSVSSTNCAFWVPC